MRKQSLYNQLNNIIETIERRNTEREKFKIPRCLPIWTNSCRNNL